MYNNVYSFLYTHTYCHIVRTLKMGVAISYKTQIPTYESTVSRCNINPKYTRHIVVTPHYHTIVVHKSPRPILSICFQCPSQRHLHCPQSSLEISTDNYPLVN